MGYKRDKSEVDYVGHAVEGKTCRECTMFRPPRACSDVEGKISPDGHCEIHDSQYGDAHQRRPLDAAIERAMALDQGE